MSDFKKVTIQTIIESQIPDFLNEDNPLFKEFLEQYYLSLEHKTGTVDLVNNYNEYKKIDNFNEATFYNKKYSCILKNDIRSFDSTIVVSLKDEEGNIIEENTTVGFPEKYGLLKIDNEIITYSSKTNNSFEGCIRGFSGLDSLKLKDFHTGDNFLVTDSSSHQKDSTVQNLNLIFFDEFFRKFKTQFLPGFENRNIINDINLKTILSRAKDYYTSKGTDESYKILFKILYNEDIEIIKPQEFILRPSANNYFKTKNILVEKIFGETNPLDLVGKTINQQTEFGVASASIYNVEVRPVDNNKILYEISLDPESFILNFTQTKVTKVLEDRSTNDDFVLVDSTIGFPKSGTLIVQRNNSTLPSTFGVSYSDKTVNQFIGVTEESVELFSGDVLLENNFAFVVEEDETVRFRILNIIQDIDFENTSKMSIGDKIKLSSFGKSLNTLPEFNSWIYNIPITHKIKSIIQTNNNTIFSINLYNNVKFLIGQEIFVYSDGDAKEDYIPASIRSIIDGSNIEIVTNNPNVLIKNKIYIPSKRAKIQQHPEITNIISNIQNTYTDPNSEKVYVASSGFPSYNITAESGSLNISTPVSGPGFGFTTILNTDKKHNFYTGEKVFITPDENLGISTGSYYVTTIGLYGDSQQLSLSYSDSDLFSRKFIEIPYNSSGQVVKADQENKELKHQKIIREFKISPNLDNSKQLDSTNNKPIGMLINGVELYSPTLFDENIYFGKIENIQLLKSGKDYDVINSPELEIIDEISSNSGISTYGYGAKAHLNIVGNLHKVKIVDPGFGYNKNIKISLIGGNGKNASLEPIIVNQKVTSEFVPSLGAVNQANNTIKFISNHNFRDSELIEYISNGNPEIRYLNGESATNLPSNTFYYVGVVDETEIKLYRSKSDSSNKINEIPLANSTSASGVHVFRTAESKSTLSEVVIRNPGSDYSNKKVIVGSRSDSNRKNNGINLIESFIYAKNHNFKEKDLVIYDSTGDEISGLVPGEYYYVGVINSDSFRLYYAGTENNISDFNYNSKIYTNLSSVGTGSHTFSYPPIVLKIESEVDNISGDVILPTLEPIVLGNIDSIFIEEYGENYGTPDILNFHRRPTVRIKSESSEAVIKPIIDSGTIIGIQILNSGKDYGLDYDLVVTGSGYFASLQPTISNEGKLIGVSILNGGIGYNNDTTIKLVKRGSGARLLCNLYEWKINQIAKNRLILESQNEGLIAPSKNFDQGLQFIHFYPPKVLREQLGDFVINRTTRNEVTNNVASPILGWAYDGFPIYGPFANIDGEIKKIRSSYKTEIELNPKLRPTRSEFPGGFFIQDFVYDRSIGDLDEFNGTYVKNNDFPDGTYAYFYTLSDNIVGGKFAPQYPYVMAENFKGSVDVNNFEPSINQDFNFEELGLIRNTSPYYLNNPNSTYLGLSSIEEKYKQEFIVKGIDSGSISSIEIYEAGDNYKVGDIIDIRRNPEDTGSGSGASASVLTVSGSNISSINSGVTTANGVSFSSLGNITIGVSTIPHNFLDNETIFISNINQRANSSLEGPITINVKNTSVGIAEDIDDVEETGDLTLIYPLSIDGFDYNDYFRINQEVFKIIDIIPEISAFRVRRNINGISGIHTSGIHNIELLPRKFEFFGKSLNLLTSINETRYFDPQTSVSLGGTTTQFYNISGIVSTIIPQNGIYIRDHNYFTGQSLTYGSGVDGQPIQVYENPGDTPFSLENGQIIYAINLGKDFIGISTVGSSTSTGIGNPLYFYSEVTNIGREHTLTTNFQETLGDVESYNLNITTEDDHNLETKDTIELEFTPKITKTVKFVYDSDLKKVVTEPLLFSVETDLSENSEIYLPENDFSTSDKVVYYSNGNPEIGGLVNKSSYYVIKGESDKIQLASTLYDSIIGNNIEFGTNFLVGNHSISKINPKISVTYGNLLEIDLTDESMLNMNFKLYKDISTEKDYPNYEYTEVNGIVTIDTKNPEFFEKIYYNFESEKKIYPDIDVISYNTIEIDDSKYENSYSVLRISDKDFRINLTDRPENIEYLMSEIEKIGYYTNSTNVTGPINSLRINYKGKNYNKIPIVNRILTESGTNAKLNIKSTNIGRISFIERVKDGFDYPSDTTLSPMLSTPAVVQVENISRIGEVLVIDGGNNYNVPPTVIVRDREDIVLEAKLTGNSVSSVNIVNNVNNLSKPLDIISIKNSNGYSIDDISVNGNLVTLELLNSNNQIYPLINVSYGSTDFIFPFNVGDRIFIENCRITSESSSLGNRNFNSSNFNYNLFTVVDVNEDDYTITYDMSEYENGVSFGEYSTDFGFGLVINEKDLAKFKMVIANDLKFISNENVYGYDDENNLIFTGKVQENGWNNDINQLRIIDLVGSIEKSGKIYGESSKLLGNIVNYDVFDLIPSVGVTREKINDVGDSTGFLNNSYQRISDNDYYQKFSYSLKSTIPYNIWKEPIKSLIHPSGFKEFSDLSVESFASKTLKVTTDPILDLEVDIDSEISLYKKTNFALVTEDEELFEDGSTERILFDDGVELKPYILSKTNKVIKIDDISSQFDGTSNFQVIANRPVTFYSEEPYTLGVSTVGLSIGDKVGFSTYHFYPDSTYIVSIGINSVGISPDAPNRLLSIGGISSVTQNLDFSRRILGDKILGKTDFKLTANGYPLFYREFDSTNIESEVIDLELNSFKIENHNFQSGQKIIYSPEILELPVAIANTTVGSGAILEPIFDSFGNYSVESIKVLFGGSGYDFTDPPKIEIINTKQPIEEATLTPNIDSITGEILSVDVGVGQSGYGYFPNYSGIIGIQTTSLIEGRKDIIIEVGAGLGGAIYESGYSYDVGITTSIIGITSSVEPDFSGEQIIVWGPIEPYIPQTFTSGSGSGARFSLLVVYDSDTGTPISTSLILRDGGSNYSVGDTVSISGTYFGGSTPENDISFVVSKLSSTTIEDEANQSYLNVDGNSVVGYGTGAKFDVYRDGNGQIEKVDLKFGGENYSLTDNVRILGTDIGGSTPDDDLFLSPTLLGTDKLPNVLYVNKKTNNEFTVSGINGTEPLNITSLGVGTHSFLLDNPNVNTLITIDNIIQTPIYRKTLELELNSKVKVDDLVIEVIENSNLLKLNDILLIEDELIRVKNLDPDNANSIIVERGVLGTIPKSYEINQKVQVVSGNYNIVKDTIYFSSAPYGDKGLPGLEVRSSFSGRVFSRGVDPDVPNDENIIFDDISDQFTGFSTEFLLKSNGNNVSGMFTNTNSITGGDGGIDINNNPLILINNIPQIGGIDYIIDTPGNNTIRFKSGSPIAGRITKVGYTTGFGYYNLVGAGASAIVSIAGTISGVQVLGGGQGYRTPPLVSVSSTVGSGASIVSEIDANGKVTAFIVINPGSGYSQSSPPDLIVELPENYSNLELNYADGYSGLGTGAKCSVIVGSGSSIISFKLDDPGLSYAVGDVLTLPQLIENENSEDFEEFQVTVLETYTDSFSGWYPGQFIQFDDISQFFNGRKKKFTLTVTISGQKQALSIKSNDIDLDITNNLFVIINDVLQVPGESYTFSGSRLVFKEAPKPGSKSNILFFRGSDLDIDQIEPPQTIKIGDEVQINQSELDPFDLDQSIRVVKDIISVDSLDTFNYDGIGINTDQNKERPLSWTKQTQDKVINGVLYSKSRPSLKSRVIPNANVIKTIEIDDTEIYVDSVTPLFQNLDETRGVDESIREVVIVDNREIESPTLESIVSPAGTLSNINIINSGYGFTGSSPQVLISKQTILRKDPIYEWNLSDLSGQTNNINSIGYGTVFVSVGNSSTSNFSYDGISWNSFNITSEGDINFSDVIGFGNTYIAVGTNASAYVKTGISTNILWEKLDILKDNTVIEGSPDIGFSNFEGDFNGVDYNINKNRLVVVGNSGRIFSASGISTDAIFENQIGTNNINSVTSNDVYFVAVGNSRTILYSTNGIIWNPSITSNIPLKNILDVKWINNRFIAVGEDSLILTSNNGISWNVVANNLGTLDIIKVHYSDGIYTLLNSDGKLYFSLNLTYWEERIILDNDLILKDIISNELDNQHTYVAVGNTGVTIYSTEVFNEAVAISSVSNSGTLESITVLNSGFGYDLDQNIPTIVSIEPTKTERLFSIKAKGDFGDIVNINLNNLSGNPGFGTTSPAIEFTLKSEIFDSDIIDLQYTPIQTGDYFVITNSNIVCGHALTGITTSLGGMSNYPNSKVGTATTFIDGVYKVEYASEAISGIVTVRCIFAPAITDGLGFGSIDVYEPDINSIDFYGKYSFGVIYDYQNRFRQLPKSFIVNSDNGIVGLNSGPSIFRTRSVV